MLSNIRIVLVRTYHPGNIGSAARAMKTMGLSDLALVNPLDFPSAEAQKMAASASDILDNAACFKHLYDAVKDCSVVIASTARNRGYDLPQLLPEESAQHLVFSSQQNKVALLFGPERMGLSNEDLQYAKYRVSIPTSPAYGSLNLAAAVQTLSYEIFKQANAEQNKQQKASAQRDLPSTRQMQQFYSHLEETLNETGFIFKKHPGQIMQKLRTLFARAQPDKTELNILRGILASCQKQKGQ